MHENGKIYIFFPFGRYRIVSNALLRFLKQTIYEHVAEKSAVLPRSHRHELLEGRYNII